MLALNKDNKVSELTPMQIKDVFDEEITNWKELGGEDLPIRVFRLEDITHYYSEEELGEAYENAGEKIMELIQKTPYRCFYSSEVCGTAGCGTFHKG